MQNNAVQWCIDRVHRKAVETISPFYKRYPYMGNLPFQRADARGAISIQDKFFYNRIPKVANSTIISSLVSHSNSVHNNPTDIDNPTGIDPKRYFPRPSEISAAVARSIPDKFFKFVFFRNPFSRTLSAYLDKVKRSTVHTSHYNTWAKKNGATLSPGFSDFCKFLQNGGLHLDAHWAPQTDCLLMPIEDFDFIGRFENLSSDINTLLRKLFPGQDPVIKNAGPPKTNASELLKAHYSDFEVEIVTRLYSEDFKQIGYSTELP